LPIARVLEVEPARPTPRGDAAGQRGLAALARTGQHHGARAPEHEPDLEFEAAAFKQDTVVMPET
jgi:hypothetical protein